MVYHQDRRGVKGGIEGEGLRRGPPASRLLGVEIPEVRYARTVDGVHIAYQVAGDGPLDLVIVASGLGLGRIWNTRRAETFPGRYAGSVG